MKTILYELTPRHTIAYTVIATLIISYCTIVTTVTSSTLLQKLTGILIPPSDQTIIHSKVFHHSYLNIICFGEQSGKGTDLTSSIIDTLKQFVAVQFQQINIKEINFTQSQTPPTSTPVYIICDVSQLAELQVALQLYDSSFDESINYFVVGTQNFTTYAELAQQYFNFSKSENYPGYVCRLTFVSSRETISTGINNVSLTNSITLSTICYLCGTKDYIFNHSFQPSSNFSSLIIELDENFKKLTNTGHGSPLRFLAFMNPVDNVALCEYNVMFLVKSDCFHIHAILSLVISKTNLTWSSSSSLQPFKIYKGPVRVDASFNFDIHAIKNVKLLLAKLYEVEELKYLYCEESTQFETVQHLVFLDRVDNLVWLLIIIISATLSILNGNVFSGFAILLIMIDQPIKFQRLFRRPGILSPVFVIIFLSWWYRSMISTDMIAPLPPKVMSTCKELFNAGYKFLVGSEQEFVHRNAGMYDEVKQKCKVELSKENFIINPNLSTKLAQFGGSQHYQEMAKIKGMVGIWGSLAMALKKLQLLRLKYQTHFTFNQTKSNSRNLLVVYHFTTQIKMSKLFAVLLFVAMVFAIATANPAPVPAPQLTGYGVGLGSYGYNYPTLGGGLIYG
ncbi:unnamed protein product [Orchesella dallaii]|uniref:Transmembrane protein n=1 Tax=Orchesella dallaii TaxID=48710 RepID=A0ABP1RL86_9HEXA